MIKVRMQDAHLISFHDSNTVKKKLFARACVDYFDGVEVGFHDRLINLYLHINLKCLFYFCN